MQNEIVEKWIDALAEILSEIAAKKPDSFEKCFQFATEIVRRSCTDPCAKANCLLFLLLMRQENGMGFDEELYDECRVIAQDIIDFDKRHDIIAGLTMSTNQAKRYDLRDKVYRRFNP